MSAGSITGIRLNETRKRVFVVPQQNGTLRHDLPAIFLGRIPEFFIVVILGLIAILSFYSETILPKIYTFLSLNIDGKE